MTRRIVFWICAVLVASLGGAFAGAAQATSTPSECNVQKIVRKGEGERDNASFSVGVVVEKVVTCSGDDATSHAQNLMNWTTRSGGCGALAVVSTANHQELCEAEPRQPVTQEIVLRALRRVTLPEPTLLIQPPGGKTLVNFDTLFRTNAESFTRTVRLLGQRVSLRITPTSFTWVHGDGTQQVTSSPGLKYESERPMTDYVRHQYEDAHVTMRPHVEVTYSAEFRVGGGAWRDVVGTVTSPGPPAPIKILEARPTLTG